jgi:HEPN domain-containing protein
MLCRLAQEDASVLPLPLPDQIFGFHAQQSCEKFFKALIAAADSTYPLTHSLERLAEALEESSETLPKMPYDVLLLEPFAVQFRYDLGASLGEEEKAAIRESVAILGDYVVKRIVALEELPGRSA